MTLTKKNRTKDKIYKYSEKNFFLKMIFFIGFIFKDIRTRMKNGVTFEEYGLTMYCGRQGAGKSMAMTEYLERMRIKYPKAIILTNFAYINEHESFKDWNDFFDVKNGTDGVIFAIDEIQNEFSSMAWKNFPESLLSEITQQRKQRVKIVCTSQTFTRVAKQLREQCMDVVECFTLVDRWTFTKAFDAIEYNKVIDSPTGKDKLRRLYRRSFIQDDRIRNHYDTYAKIQRIARTDFMSKQERA